MQLNSIKGLLLSCGLFFSSTTAFSAVTVYTNEAAWLAATSGTVFSENFESSPLGLLAVGTTDIGSFDITITSNAEQQIEIADAGSINGSRQFNGDVDADSTLSVDFSNFSASPLYAFAGEWNSTTSGDRLTVDINGQVIQFDNYLGVIGSGFLGFTDTDGFTNLTFGTEGTTTFGEYFSLDNVQFASASVPDASSIFLLAFGLLGLLNGVRRKI